jgi:BirA family biotin operon repressor/biotin-[acetyl-CoA-carboxylase] ligase
MPVPAQTASGTPIRHHAHIESTNAEAMRLAVAGEPGPLWVLADAQSTGRGRSGRDWVSPPGNLYASYLFSTRAPLASAHQLSLVAGVATHDALLAIGLTPAHGLRLKWPNDVLAGGGKIAGILIESTSAPGTADLRVIAGIGVNVASHPAIPGRHSTSLAAHGIHAPTALVLDALDAALRHVLKLWDASAGFAAVRTAWLSRAHPMGEPLSINTGTGHLTGRFAGLDSDGALLLDLEGGERRRCTYGDVTIG